MLENSAAVREDLVRMRARRLLFVGTIRVSKRCVGAYAGGSAEEPINGEYTLFDR